MTDTYAAKEQAAASTFGVLGNAMEQVPAATANELATTTTIAQERAAATTPGLDGPDVIQEPMDIAAALVASNLLPPERTPLLNPLGWKCEHRRSRSIYGRPHGSLPAGQFLFRA